MGVGIVSTYVDELLIGRVWVRPS